ncbi:MAG: hypothetical protein M1829_001366 [Trizodia sp. TS-e1964]|nr:MAG: hypothetical protein M1829_001366 [Trizodia sp. TS-e1964]
MRSGIWPPALPRLPCLPPLAQPVARSSRPLTLLHLSLLALRPLLGLSPKFLAPLSLPLFIPLPVLPTALEKIQEVCKSPAAPVANASTRWPVTTRHFRPVPGVWDAVRANIALTQQIHAALNATIAQSQQMHEAFGEMLEIPHEVAMLNEEEADRLDEDGDIEQFFKIVAVISIFGPNSVYRAI